MRRLLLAAMASLALVLSACGGVAAPKPDTSPPSCHRSPGAAGDCIRQELRSKGFALRPVTASSLPQCVDISRWQGFPDWSSAKRAGIRCVIVQTNDGFIENPFFWIQVAQLRNAHLPWGTYTFLEGRDPAGQARLSARMAAGKGRSLGMWGDAEQPSAYPVTCAYVNEASRHSHIVGVYGSPGTYRGGRCKGKEWVANWQTHRSGTLPGYPASAVALHQWCGTCRLAGFGGEVDRDESLGLLSLAKPAPTDHQRLLAAERRRDELLADLHRHGCFHVHGKKAYKLCPRWGHEWRVEEALIRALR